jgi:hypothetical protein
MRRRQYFKQLELAAFAADVPEMSVIPSVESLQRKGRDRQEVRTAPDGGDEMIFEDLVDFLPSSASSSDFDASESESGLAQTVTSRAPRRRAVVLRNRSVRANNSVRGRQGSDSGNDSDEDFRSPSARVLYFSFPSLSGLIVLADFDEI